MNSMSSEDVDAIEALANGYRFSQALYVAAVLGVADELVCGALTVGEIAHRTATDAPSLYRLLRALVGLGILTEETPGSFGLSKRGQLLRKDIPESLHPRACSIGERWNWGPWGDLLESVRTGEPSFERLYGMTPFEYFDQMPGTGNTFQRRMALEGARRGAAVAAAHDFSTKRTIVDLGSGQGALLAAILQRFPSLQGILVDLASALSGAEELLARAGVFHRCQIMAGDFFTSIPEGEDIYLLSAILHSWSDQQSLKILTNCRRAMRSTSRVLIIDEVIHAGLNSQTKQLIKDLQLMVNTRGRQRTEREFTSLLVAANLDIVSVTSTGHSEYIIEARRSE
jgi:hypothetical protein